MNQRLIRKFHRQIAPILFLPLFFTALTGVAYRVGRNWLGLSGNAGELLLSIHQGSFLGPHLKVFYVLLNGLGVIAMLFTGIYMTSIFRSKRTE